jgi:hypothetical protein
MATRSPHRPNPIGLSLCKLDRVEADKIYLSGIDVRYMCNMLHDYVACSSSNAMMVQLVDGTPILDVKPYLPFFDNPGTQVGLAVHCGRTIIIVILAMVIGSVSFVVLTYPLTNTFTTGSSSSMGCRSQAQAPHSRLHCQGSAATGCNRYALATLLFGTC